MGLEPTSPGDVDSSPIRGIQPIFSKEYIERKKDAHMHLCSIPFIATFVFLLWINTQNLNNLYWYRRPLNLLEKVLERPGEVLEFYIQLTVATLLKTLLL